MYDIDPRNIIDLIHYKIGYKLYSFLKDKTHSNIIIHGPNGSGKSLLIRIIMNNIYPGLLLDQKLDAFQLLLHNNYYLFNCSSIHNKLEFIEFIKKIIQTYDYYNSNCKYIVFDQFEKLNENLQNSLKVIIEKACYTCKFIILTNQYNKLISPIKSRCVSIRVPLPHYYDKFIYLKYLFKKRKVNYNQFHLLKECKSKTIQNIIYQYTYGDCINLHLVIYNTIHRLIYLPKLKKNDIIKIREVSSKIKELNIPVTYFLIQFICSLKNKDNYNELIKVCSDYDNRIVHSYRELIHIESLIIHLNLIANNIYNHGLL